MGAGADEETRDSDFNQTPAVILYFISKGSKGAKPEQYCLCGSKKTN
jgi:hypothetical protein